MSAQNWKRMWARKFSPFMSSIFILSYYKGSEFGAVKNKLFVPEGNLYAMYFDANEAKEIVKKYGEFLKQQDLPSYAVSYEARFQDFLSWSKAETQRNFSSLSNDELGAMVGALTKGALDFMEAQFLAFFMLEGVGREVEEKLAGEPDLLQAIATPYKHTRITQAKIAVLEMARDGRTSDADIEAYLKEYSWMPVYDFVDPPSTAEDIRKQLATISDATGELATIEHHQVDGLARYKEYLSTLPDGDWKKLVEIGHYFAYLKEMRDDYRRHSYFLWIPFWQELAKRLSLSLEEVNCLLEPELVEALTQGKDHSVLAKERLKKYAHWLKDGVLHTYTAEEADKVAALVHEEMATTELKGSCASKGKASGPARIVYHQGEFSKFQDGDVLVTTMTHPEFLIVMKKARAIVTDEGGITCHAAIVSRELGIPCVIGTKNATRVLKDGDMIEVDAEKGTVRKV